MDKINRNNYEAYFLDFAEGNLSEEERKDVLDFIQANPDLKEELEEFELIQLPVEDGQSENWADLKKEKNYASSQDLRDELYFKALEEDLTEEEGIALSELQKRREFVEEYELWKKLKLSPSTDQSEWSDLYELGLDKEITKDNFEHFLIARAEGLLSEKQDAQIQKIAGKIPGGEKELALAEQLRLKASVGVFYPDKDKLYKKKERAGLLIWFARTAAVAALFIMGYFIIGQFQNSQQQPIAEQAESDSTKTKEKEQGEVEEYGDEGSDEKKNKVRTIPTNEPQNLQASASEKDENKPAAPVKMNRMESISPKTISLDDAIDFGQAIALRNERIIEKTKSIEEVQPVEPAYTDYQTIPELAEDYLVSRFDYNQSSNRGFVPTMAQKIADKAGEALDAEIKTEENQADNSSKFTFRVGNFKVTRSNSK